MVRTGHARAPSPRGCACNVKHYDGVEGWSAQHLPAPVLRNKNNDPRVLWQQWRKQQGLTERGLPGSRLLEPDGTTGDRTCFGDALVLL